MTGYISLCLTAFLAATPLPMNSEVVFLALQAAGYNLTLLIIFASIANTLGSCVTYWCGKSAHKLRGGRWFPFPENGVQKAENIFKRWGYWSLIFSWIPGGELVVAFAGFVKMNFWIFLALMIVGKTLRYLVLGLIANGILALF